MADVDFAYEEYAGIRNKKSSAALLARLIEHHPEQGIPDIAPADVAIQEEAVPDPVAEVPPLPSPHGGHRIAFQKWIDSFEPLPTTYPTVHTIQKCVAGHFGVSVLEICSHGRESKFVKPRQIAMYLTKQLTPRSYPDIARKFGNRDHTTALYSIKKIARLLETDEGLRDEVSQLQSQIGGMNA
jgi:hypothetical protein